MQNLTDPKTGTVVLEQMYCDTVECLRRLFVHVRMCITYTRLYVLAYGASMKCEGHSNFWFLTFYDMHIV